MIYRCLLFIIFFTVGCTKPTKVADESEQPTREQLHKEYILNLHDRNMEEVYRNQDFVNMLSVKYQIADSICTTIIIDYLTLVYNTSRDYGNDFKVGSIKNYAFENDLQEEQVAGLLYDYISYRDSKRN